MRRITDAGQLRVWKAAVVERRRSDEKQARIVASGILDAVRSRGDEAVAESLQRFDGVTMAPGSILLNATEGEVSSSLDAEIALAVDRIRRFHEGQVQTGFTVDIDGVETVHRVTPLRRIGIYVPGGKAVYLSTLLMCAVPARLAGVAEIVVATTPAAAARPELLAACRKLGITEIYRCGGAAGIAAMAIGTSTLRPVDKIVGPGNLYVTAAKQLLFGEVGIDMTAGPTEIVIVADETADASLVAADLLAQAEHGDDSTAVVVTDSIALADRIDAALDDQLAAADSPAARRALERNGAIVIVPLLTDGIDLANELAPEHAELMGERAEALVDLITDCGAVFVGASAGVALGDYIAGPNHVLPTAGAARFASPLGVYDFYKRSNVVRVRGPLSSTITTAAAAIARFEGLPMHARSLELRALGGVVR